MRAYQPGDLHAVVDLLNRSEQAITGQNLTSPADFTAEMQSYGFDPGIDTVLILIESGTVIGYADLFADQDPVVRMRSFLRVHPEYRSRDEWIALLEWTEARARQLLPRAPAGARVVLQNSVYAAETNEIAWLEVHGYQYVRSSYRMLIDLEKIDPQPLLPEGISLRPLENTEADLRAAAWVDHQAFLDHWGAVEQPFEVFYQKFKHRFETDPNNDLPACRLAFDGNTAVGLSICRPRTEEDADKGWVSILCVLRSWRKRGIGQALLAEAFSEFKRRGKKRAGLFVDAGNLTGALQLYLRAGMQVEFERQIYEKELRPGAEWMVRGTANSQ
jgi:ribosomal protein S18 acetylase RimI-like enzyme